MDDLTNIRLNERCLKKQLINCMISFILNRKAERSVLLEVRIVFRLRAGSEWKETQWLLGYWQSSVSGFWCW